MHVQALDASAINALASSSETGYDPPRSPMHPAADTVGRAWRTITASYATAFGALEHELGARHGLGVSEFEVLDRLAESADHKFRAQELAESVHLSQSSLSRLIDRLARVGLVERCLCDMDRRGIYVTLTAGSRPH